MQRPLRPQRRLSKRCFARFAIFAFNVILSPALLAERKGMVMLGAQPRGDVLFWIRASGLRREARLARGWGPARYEKEGRMPVRIVVLLLVLSASVSAETIQGRCRVAARLRRPRAEALLPLRERQAAVRSGAELDARRHRAAHATAHARASKLVARLA